MGEIRYQGVCKWFGSKGEAYGYIHGFKAPDGTDGEIFVHFKQISVENQDNPKFRILRKGARVEFSIGSGYPSERHGTQALNVVVLKDK